MTTFKSLLTAVVFATGIYIFTLDLAFSTSFDIFPASRYGLPTIGLGTWLSKKGKVAEAVQYSLELGYHHIDAASVYGNEKEVGEGIAASGVPRENIWVTSKLWNSDHRPENVRRAIEKTISDLGVGYLDLYLMHWPVAFVPGEGTKLDNTTSIVDTWHAMEDLVKANLTRSIGISNFAPDDVEEILKAGKIRPYAHELETHPYLQQQEFVDYHAKKGIKVIAYSPLANTNPTYHTHIPLILKDPFWKHLAKKKKATVAQVVLAWGRQRGTIVIPKSVHPKHIRENWESLEVKLSKHEMKQIAKQDKKLRQNNPGKGWGVKLFKGLDDPGKKDSNTNEL